ncbi:MAG TPA: F0F1 ATP synthase subunit B, partial [Porphyromonadaceae bacterium]|nr:F0F1 ATP synthase subunit B [Porphyromonadaceae bacterium]
MSLLTPDPGLVFWMSISFGIVLLILAKFAFPAIIKAVDKRT